LELGERNSVEEVISVWNLGMKEELKVKKKGVEFI
jgi:hypothetical protein